MKYTFSELDYQAVQYGVLGKFLKTFTKKSKVLQTHDYLIIEDKDFKGKILDVGCGPGKLGIMAKLLDPKTDITLMDGSIINIEISLTLIQNAKLDKYLGDTLKLRLGMLGDEIKEKYDTVVLNHIVEHLDDLDEAFDWIINITKPGGTIFIAVPYKDCHFSPNHTRFFKVSADPNEGGMINKDVKCFNIDKYLEKRGYRADIAIYDESKADPRQPYDSRGQLDMSIKIKVPDNSGVVASDTVITNGKIDKEDWYKKPLPTDSIIKDIPLK